MKNFCAWTHSEDNSVSFEEMEELDDAYLYIHDMIGIGKESSNVVVEWSITDNNTGEVINEWSSLN